MSTRKPKPIGFLSYAHFDDEHNQGWISAFVRVLKNEVQAQTGEPFAIFQDRMDIRWGDNWRERINSSLRTATLFFPIITPSFFKSTECKKELREFLEHENSLGRGDLIFPVYYIKCRPLEAKSAPKNSDKLVRVLRKRQRWDWTDLRFESLDDLKIRKVLAGMAIEIRDAIERTSTNS